MNKILRPFHLAIPVANLEKAKKFYTDLLGCAIGRSSETWIDLNFYGHQLVIHLSNIENNTTYNNVDLHSVPVPHFGIILTWNAWNKISRTLKNKIDFIIKPQIRFKNKIGEQATMFFKDNDNNFIELKAFKDDKMIFKKND